MQGQTLVFCLLGALAVVAGANAVGQPLAGTGVAIGLIIGAFNGFTFQAVLDRRAPILVTSIVRLSFFSLLALIAVRLLGGPVWPVVLGVAGAQLVMAALAVREGLRA